MTYTSSKTQYEPYVTNTRTVCHDKQHHLSRIYAPFVTIDSTIHYKKKIKKYKKLSLRNRIKFSFKKSKGSNLRKKVRTEAARLHEHVSNQRSDMLHKLSTKLIRWQYNIICSGTSCKTSLVQAVMVKPRTPPRIYPGGIN